MSKQTIQLNNGALLNMRQRYEASREHVVQDLYEKYGVRVSTEVLRSWESAGSPKSCVVLAALSSLYGCSMEELITRSAPLVKGVPDGPF